MFALVFLQDAVLPDDFHPFHINRRPLTTTEIADIDNDVPVDRQPAVFAPELALINRINEALPPMLQVGSNMRIAGVPQIKLIGMLER